jgi:hypothetical protein
MNLKRRLSAIFLTVTILGVGVPPTSVRAQAVRARDWVLSERTWEANAKRLEGLTARLGV